MNDFGSELRMLISQSLVACEESDIASLLSFMKEQLKKELGAVQFMIGDYKDEK